MTNSKSVIHRTYSKITPNYFRDVQKYSDTHIPIIEGFTDAHYWTPRKMIVIFVPKRNLIDLSLEKRLD